MKQVRAKLQCVDVAPFDNGATENPEKAGEVVKFEARYDAADSEEDNSFSKYTPSANMTMCVTNPDVFGAFEVGKKYYFDIVEA